MAIRCLTRQFSVAYTASLKTFSIPMRFTMRKCDQASVIVASGPRLLCESIQHIRTSLSLAKNKNTIHSFSVIGDGENGISLNSVVKKIEKEKQDKRPITLFIQAHGAITNEEHEIALDEDHLSIFTMHRSLVSSSSRGLFRLLKRMLGDEYPLSVFMASCYGGAAAQAAVDELPKRSIFITLCGKDEKISAIDVEKFIIGTFLHSKAWCNSEQALYYYLANHFKFNNTTPMIAYGTENILDLKTILDSQIGRLFSEEQKIQVHDHLDELMGKDKVESLIERIQDAEEALDLASDYSCALAVALAGKVDSI